MIGKILSVFHGAFSGIYPYVAIVLLATLSWGLWEAGKASEAEAKKHRQELKELKVVAQRMVEMQLKVGQQLGIRQKMHETLQLDAQTFERKIDESKDSCLDAKLPPDIAGMLSSPH